MSENAHNYMAVESSIPIWDIFLRRYYWDEILALATDYTQKQSLYVDYRIVATWNFNLANQLIESPDKVITHAWEAVKAMDLPIDVSHFEPYIRFKNLPTTIKRRELRQKDVGHLVQLEVIVTRVSPVAPKILIGAFKCGRCGEVTYQPQSDGIHIEPYECGSDACGRKGCLKLQYNQSEFIDAQKLRIQERPEDLMGTEKTQTIDVDVTKDIVGMINPGNRVLICGILRITQKATQHGKSNTMEMYFEALSYEIHDSNQAVEVTPDDIKMLLELAKDPKIIDKLVQSFAPSVYGMQKIKEGMLSCGVSTGYSVRNDGTPQRDLSHMLVVGDPGTAKSNLKYAMKEIMPQIVLTDGTGSTKAGLTAAAIKDEFDGGKYSIEAGVLPLADGSGCIIDEFDKFDREDIKCLNGALSNCQFEKDAGGMHMKLWARCFVIALQNPKAGRIDQDVPIAKQINIPPDTISRFDLIFIEPDVPDENIDAIVGGTMADAWTNNIHKPSVPVAPDILKKYISYARTINPVFDDDTRIAIVACFVNTRKQSNHDIGQVAITKRYLEALFRLSRNQAKLMLSDRVTIEHFNGAVRLLNASLLQTATDSKGHLDADIIESGLGHDQRTKIKHIMDTIREICSENGNGKHGAKLEDIIVREKTLTEQDLKDYISKLKSFGEILETSHNRFNVAR